MENEHIIELLEENKFKDLSSAEVNQIEAHARSCAPCARAYESAQVSQVLVRERAAQIIEPPPFFETRVLAAWRERQAAMKPAAWRLWQMWRDAKLLISGLATAVVLLMILTFAVPRLTNTAPTYTAMVGDDYSVESIVFDAPDAPDDLTDDQVLQDIYGADDEEN